VQIGISASATLPGFELAGEVTTETGSIFPGQPSEGGTGFEALLAALVAGSGNGQTELNIEKLKVDGVTPETQEIIDALAGMAEALVPLANAFDKLQIPTADQLDAARGALSKLVESINAHPNRPNLPFKGQIGEFAAQLSQLRQAGIDATKEGSSDFGKVGQLMERLDKILNEMSGTPAAATLQANGEKSGLNIHQMVDRLNQLAEKLPTLPAQIAAQQKTKNPFGNTMIEAQTTQGSEGNPSVPRPTNVSDARPLVQGASVSNQSTQDVRPPQQNAPVKGAETDVLAQIANLGQQHNNGAKKAERPLTAPNPAGIAPSEGAEQPSTKITFAQVSREANLHAANAYPEMQKSAQVPTATAPLASELDAVETGTEKLLGQHKIETFQQQTNLIDTAKSQTSGRQVNIPGVAFEIVRQFRGGMQRFEVRLDPPEMGRIDVRMEVEGNNVTARLVVERAETLDFLQRDARALERALQQAGLNADRANLQFSLKQDGQGSNPDFGNQGKQDDISNSAGLDAIAEDQSDMSDPSVYRGTTGPGGLNLWV